MFSGRNLLLIGLIAVSAIIFTGCGDDSPTGSYQNPLNGTWSETYGEVFFNNGVMGNDTRDFAQGAVCCTLTAVLTINGREFGLKIFDKLDILLKELKGEYYRIKDSLIFNVNYTWARYYDAVGIEHDPYTKYSDTLKYEILNGNSLVFQTKYLYDEGSGFTYIRFNSILWSVPGAQVLKSSGTFVRRD